MQFLKKPPSFPRWLHKSPRLLCILGFVCIYLLGYTTFVPQASAATLGMPGGHVSDPVVRQVDIARPAVVRIVTTINGSLTVRFTSTVTATFPQGGGNYPIELSGSGAFISAHGDILTADHVVNPPHDQALNGALYQEAAQDIADYINTHFQVSQPFTASDVVVELETGAFPSTPTYQQPTSQVYLSTAYSGPVNAAKFSEIPSSDRAEVDRIEAQSSFDAMDVAIVHVTGMDDMPSIQLDDSSQVEELDNLTIIGYPGLGDVSNAPTNLLTSSVNKIYVSAIKTTDSGAPVIQVGGNVEHGDSGAPALDDNGNIVGIVSFGIYDPNESGQTSFLQASNSAKTLIQSQGIDTAPGPFERAWTQAFDDYASATAGHWHKAVQEFQSLANSYKGFVGLADYLTYAQDQANREQPPTSPFSGPNPVLIVILILLVLVVLGAIFFVVTKQRSQPALASISQFPSTPFGTYAPPQNGVSGIYPPPPESYSSPGYAQPGPASGVYQPVAGSSSPDYAQPMSGQAAGSYPPDPASYATIAWSEQANSLVPQTPLPVVNETPLPVDSSQTTQTSAKDAVPFIEPVQTPQPLENSPAVPTTISAGEREQTLPTWVPPAPISEQVLTSSEFVDDREQILSEAQRDLPFARPFLPSESMWPAVTASSEENDTAIAAQSSAPARSFSVPKRPSNSQPAGQETLPEDSSSGAQVIIGPCGHANIPDARFCRICGQLIVPSDAQDKADASTF